METSAAEPHLSLSGDQGEIWDRGVDGGCGHVATGGVTSVHYNQCQQI